MAFDENKYKAIFDQRFGAGSFDSGMKQAQDIGRSKVQAEFAKQDYNRRLKEAQKQQKAAQKKAEKKTYDDAVSYWNDPANKDHLLGRGVKQTENDILNDPRAKKAIKDLGFTQSDFIDAMYNVASSGSQLSKRGFNQDQKKEKDTVSEKPQKLIKIKPEATASEKPLSLIPLKPAKKEVKAPTVKKKEDTTLWDDAKALGKATLQGFNPFDGVSMEQAVKNYTNRNTSKTFDEIARGSNRAVDSASIGVMSNLDKKLNNRDQYYLSERKWGEGKGTDMITTGLGYLAPGLGAVKGVRAVGLGVKAGAKGLPLIGQLAKEGAIVGGALSGAEVGVREGLNPNDYNWKQNLGYVGQNVALGAVADPLLHGAGKVIGKGFESASNRTMQNLLPQQEQVLKGFNQSIKGSQALPKPGGIQNPGVFGDLLPKGNDIANPNYVPNLIPKSQPPLTVPKVGTPLEEALANPRLEPPITQPQAPQQAPIAQTIPKQREPVIQQGTPIQEPKKPNERSFYNTVQNPDKLSPELRQRLEEFDKTYKPMSNQELVDHANEYVANDMEKAYQFVKNAKKFDPRHITVAHRLIDELQKAGEFDKALDVVERVAEQGTKAGQSVQSYSIYNRLTAEGQLVRAQRHVNKINQDITDPAKQVKLTPQHVEDITQTADSIQKFAGQMDQANNVMKIMENVKKGKVATDSELETVRSFVSDAKKFFGDLDPNVTAPKVKPVKDVRTRDKVVDFMSKKEDVARKELQKIFGRANSMPVDAFYHLSVIGASKIAKGTVKLTDFTEEMVKDFGEMVRPYAKQIYNKAVETFNLQSESMTAKRLSEVEKITNKALKDKNLDPDQAESIREFARQVGRMSGDAKLENSMELQSILQDLSRPTFGQRLSSTQTIAQLLNPKTVVRNAIGNEMFYRIEQINKLLATPVDIVRSKITGGDRTITFITNNQGQYWRNWLTGAKSGWKGVNPMGLQTQYDLGPTAFRSKWNPLTYLEKSLGATLRSFDHAGYMRAYNNTLGEIATLRAVNEGLKGEAKKEAIARYIREADENMLQIADQYGKYATFQDNSPIAYALQKAKRGMNFRKDFGIGDLVLKYPKTPGNIIMRAFEYSPAGIARTLYILKGIGKSKNPLTTKEATLAFTRAIIGTGGFSLLGYVLADKGILTTAGNSNTRVAALERNAGKQPNSVNVSALNRFIQSGLDLKKTGTKKGDTFVSFDWAQPLSIAMALGTGMNQSKKEEGKVSGYEALKNAGDSVLNTTVSMSVLKGVKDLLTSYPGQSYSDKFGGVIEGAVGSFVPTLSNQVRQSGDNTSRSTYSPDLLPTIKNKAINRIPVLQKQLPPAYDTLGNKKENFQGGSNNLFNVFLNPSFVSKYKPSSEAQFVLDTINATGDETLAPRFSVKKLDGKQLTSEQYVEFQRIMGEEVKKGLKGMTSSGDTEKDADKIDKVLKAAGKVARKQIRQEMGD